MRSCNLSLTLALDGVGGEREDPTTFLPGIRPGTHCLGYWVGHRTFLDFCGKSLSPARYSIPGTSSPLASHYTLCAIPYKTSRNSQTQKLVATNSPNTPVTT